jgi:tetratricopeptide (TPR) repeat protein
MIVETSVKPERKFVRDGLPWAVGAAALAAYLATLNHWMTLSSLPQVARANGWDWQPMLSRPLLYLLTCPFGRLPEGWVPVALNGFAALCACLTLAMLARSVALLPHDRVEQQRLLVQNQDGLLSLPNAWVPVVLASAALGLQLTFWENAIAATGEMLDLLLFAYVIRCLLEYRIDQRQSWLGRAAFVFGAAIANNWGMAGFLPLFLVALFRLRRVSLFNFHSLPIGDQDAEQITAPGLPAETRPLFYPTESGDGLKVDVIRVKAESRFLLRMTLIGLAGLSLFLVLPLVQRFSPDSGFSFWQALHAAAVSYKTTLQLFFGRFLRHNRDIALLLAAVSLLPVLLLSIRWSGSGFTASHARSDFAPLIFQLIHAFLLLICVWTVFDPPFSPRQASLRFGLPMTFLPLYYLTALSIGYYSGFLLLLFGADAQQRLSPGDIYLRATCRAVPKLVYVLAGMTVAGLVMKNAPVIRAGGARYLEEYARLAAGSLPPEGAVVLSDDPDRLAILQAAIAREGKSGRYLPVVTRALPLATYRAWLRRKYPGRWLEPTAEVKLNAGRPAASVTNAPLDDFGVMRLLSRLAQSNHVYCVQAGVPLVLEQFYLQPHGLLHEMKFYSTNSLSGGLLGPMELAENEAFWKHAIETGVQPLLQLVAEPQIARPNFEKRLMKWGRLQTPPPAQAKVLARWYSGALNRWGVTLQRNGRPSDAAPCFALAQELNTDNLQARVNLQCNSNLLAGQKMTVARDRSFQEQFNGYLARIQALAENGPFDEPSYCFQLGLHLAQEKMLRQAGQQFERVKALAPGDSPARLMLGEVFCLGGWPDQALQIAAEMRAAPDLQPLGTTNEVWVALLEARAWFAKTNRLKAEGIVNSLLASHPDDAGLLERAESLLARYGSFSNALQIADRQLQSTPNDPTALINKGQLLLLTGDFSNSIPPLTRSLAVTNTGVARLQRANAYRQSGRLDAAEADYQEVLRAFPTAYRTYYWLGEIAWEKKDTNAAIRYYQHYLSNAVGRTEEFRIAAARLKSLQQGRN